MRKHKLAIFTLSFASGLPFLLILSTLSIWLAESDISKTTIGLLTWVSAPYAFKFLWGGIVETKKIPWLTAKLGKRRSWILCGQILVMFALVCLANTSPELHLFPTVLFALLVGCGSALQDIAVEAYRIEIMPSRLEIGASAAVLGYRLGMLLAGGGTVFLATYFHDWGIAYNCIALFMLIGIITTLYIPEPTLITHKPLTVWQGIRSLAHQMDWPIVLPFLFSYKIVDTTLNVMSMPFLVELGFSNLEIASIAETFGIIAMIIGGILGGILGHKYRLRYLLITCVLFQMFSSILFIAQAYLGHNVQFLFVSVGIENLTCGMSQVALITYLSYLCKYKHIALHYALLTSCASLMRLCISSVAGFLADKFIWQDFYSIVALSVIPSMIILLSFVKHFSLDKPVTTLESREELVNVN